MASVLRDRVVALAAAPLDEPPPTSEVDDEVLQPSLN
jgi:hypothetical protein